MVNGRALRALAAVALCATASCGKKTPPQGGNVFDATNAATAPSTTAAPHVRRPYATPTPPTAPMRARAWSRASRKQVGLADLGTRAFFTVGTAFFELGPELRRIPEMSRGLPRARLRGVPPSVVSIGGRWPDRAFLSLDPGDPPLELYRWNVSEERWVADTSWSFKSSFGSFYVADVVAAGDSVFGRIEVSPISYADEGERWRARATRPTLVVLAGDGHDDDESTCFRTMTGTKTGTLFALGAPCRGGFSQLYRWETPSSGREHLDFEDPNGPYWVDAIAADDVVAGSVSSVHRFDGATWTLQPAPADTARAWLLDGGSMLIGRPSGEYTETLWRLEPDGTTTPLPLMFGEKSLHVETVLRRSATEIWAIGVEDFEHDERYVLFSTIASTSAVNEIVMTNLATEQAERDEPEPFTPTCVDQSLWLLGELPKTVGASPGEEARKRARIAKASNGVYEEVRWRGKRYAAVESRFRIFKGGDKDYLSLRDWVHTLGGTEERHYCRFFPALVRTIAVDDDSALHEGRLR